MNKTTKAKSAFPHKGTVQYFGSILRRNVPLKKTGKTFISNEGHKFDKKTGKPTERLAAAFCLLLVNTIDS